VLPDIPGRSASRCDDSRRAWLVCAGVGDDLVDLGLGEAAGTEVTPRALRVHHQVGAHVICFLMKDDRGCDDARANGAARLP
jgi:hypothetical protein